MDDRTTQRAEWAAGWKVTLAAFAGAGLTPLVIYPLGLFIIPLQEEFGWSRAFIASGLTVNSILGVLCSTLVGVLIDRLGARVIAIAGVLVFCLTFGLLSTANGNMFQWWGLWLVLSIGTRLANTMTWTAAVASRFAAARGLALGVVMGGASVSGILAPPVGAYLIGAYGWRWGFAGLALIWFAVVMPLVLAFFYSARDLARSNPAAAAVSTPAAAAAAKARGWAALRSANFIKLLIATGVVIGLLTSAVVHFAPLVIGAGLDRTTAAAATSVVGATAFGGRLVIGVLLDRFNPRLIGALMFALPAAPFAALLFYDGGAASAFAIAVAFGLCSGAGITVASFLTARLFGMENFGFLFGTIAAATSLSSGLGPISAGHVQDTFGSYDVALWAAIPLSLLGGLLVFSLRTAPQGQAPARAIR